MTGSRLASGVPARSRMACHSSATTRAPSSWAFSGPMTPFCSGTSSTFFSRRTWRTLNFGCCWARTSRSGLLSSGRSLLESGAMVVAVASGDRLSNHCQNGPAANGSRSHDAAGQAAPEAGVGQQQWQHDQGRVVAAGQQVQTVAQDVGGARAKAVAPDGVEGAEQAVGDDFRGAAVPVGGVERVDADRRLVERVEDDDVAAALLRDTGQQIGDEILGLDDHDRPVGLEVLQDQVEQQRALAYPVRADDPGVPQGVGSVVADSAARTGRARRRRRRGCRIALRAGPHGARVQWRLAWEVFVTVGDRPAGQPGDLGDGQALRRV